MINGEKNGIKESVSELVEGISSALRQAQAPRLYLFARENKNVYSRSVVRCLLSVDLKK